LTYIYYVEIARHSNRRGKAGAKDQLSPCIAKQVIAAVKGVETTPEEGLLNLISAT
jgi:hypothetical protein